MSMVVPLTLLALTAAFVFAAGWRLSPPQNSLAGGLGALLLFLMHPSTLSGIRDASPWDAFYVMVFMCAWLWMEHWSLFMRSWVLAGIYAFGLWVGSPFALWGMVAMVPWVIFNRRPLPAFGSMVNVFLGGLFLFAVSWGIAYFAIPNLGRPLFTQWIRWGGIRVPPGLSLPWCLLVLSALVDRFQDMTRNRRTDASTYMAILLVVTVLLGSTSLGVAMMALSTPLIMRVLAKREFLYHRGVRWVAAVTLVISIALTYGLHQNARTTTGLAIILVVLSARRFYSASTLPWFLAAEAACVGAYFAESLGLLLQIFPQ